jgi:Malectin domain
VRVSLTSLSFFSWWYAEARVFDVTVAGTKISSLDLVFLSGQNVAYTTTLTVTTTGPNLTIAMAASKDKVTISAIEIRAVVPASTKSPVVAPTSPVAAPTSPVAPPMKSPVVAAAPSTVSPVLIDCGSTSSYTDSQNRLWLADVYYDNQSGVFSTTNAIHNSLDDKLYQTERTGVTVVYNIPRPPGTYAVTLHFAEI